MQILAIETATMAGSIAIVNEEKVISEMTLNVRATHSEKLMSAVDHLLHVSSMALGNMDGIAVSIGPGSFTGLRIGLSTAKGLAYASNKPLTGVSTLDALAWNIVFSETLVCPILDARKGEVYAAIYRRHGLTMEKITGDMAITPVALCEMIKEDTVFIGDGVNTYRELLIKQLGKLYNEAPAHLLTPRGSNVGMLALERLRHKQADDPFTLIPRYVRKSEAEIRWSK